MRILLAVLLAAGSGLAQMANPLQKAIVLGPATVYLSPDTDSAKVGTLRAGEQMGVQAASGRFTQVFSGISGWVDNHDFVLLSAPDAARVIFGAAVEAQQEAEQSNEDPTAAVRLYLSIYNFLPLSARAGEALYRGAALQWDTKISEEPTRTSPTERLFPDDSLLHRVENKYRDTPWAAQAAFKLLIEHFTCGDWFEKPACVGNEADRYNGYVHKYPTSPDAPHAAFDALYRDAIAWTIYRQPGKNQDTGKAAEYRQRVAEDSARMQQAYANRDWTARGAYVAYQVAHDSPLKLPGSTPMGGP
ncbi:MAG: hypothetical protein ACRD1C_06250 [Terriglobales bacterium]